MKEVIYKLDYQELQNFNRGEGKSILEKQENGMYLRMVNSPRGLCIR